ncbi:uncharacterized protein LOC133072245 isoform X2 [Dama dama]|uniref:uncharacterized protein LOC133072245 isoform X2 n=1 Tax=Dama dama TaxID=30532 RepID=UPI002A35898E|nr:uncharacterized protein LOC133072245 isoform X2 [Dama dama]
MRATALLLVVLAPVMQVSSNFKLITSGTGETASFTCDLTQGATYIHLYKHEEGTAPRRLLYFDSYNSKPVLESGISGEKYHVYKRTERRYAFAILNLKESDSGIYYCVIWNNYIKNFNVGAKLIVTERNLAADTSPKPTIFLPSIAEINHDNAGTYLCLLEKFFPDVITVSWKVKNSNRVLPSQQRNTMKTKDTYMKLSWLTVTKNSMDKQHVCVVKHMKNIGGIDQEIIFPSIKEVVSAVVPTTEPPTTEPPTTEPPTTEPLTTEPPTTEPPTTEPPTTEPPTTEPPTTEPLTTEPPTTEPPTTEPPTTEPPTTEPPTTGPPTTEPPTTEPPTTEPPDDCLTDESEATGTGSKKACLKDKSEVTADTNSTKSCLEGESSTLELQLINTSAYYTYLLLLLISTVYFVIITSRVFRRTGICCDGKIS